jgi:hypothetical protein
MTLPASPEGAGATHMHASHATDTPTCKPATNMAATATETATHMPATEAAVATATEAAATAVAATTAVATTTTTSHGIGRHGGRA